MASCASTASRMAPLLAPDPSPAALTEWPFLRLLLSVQWTIANCNEDKRRKVKCQPLGENSLNSSMLSAGGVGCERRRGPSDLALPRIRHWTPHACRFPRAGGRGLV